MPKIAVYKYFVFFFYAFDIKERRHVHVEIKKGRFRSPAKIWFENGVEVAEPGNLSKKEINLAVKLIRSNLELFQEQFEIYIKEGKVKSINLKGN